jgi:hypothetical protein
MAGPSDTLLDPRHCMTAMPLFVGSHPVSDQRIATARESDAMVTWNLETNLKLPYLLYLKMIRFMSIVYPPSLKHHLPPTIAGECTSSITPSPPTITVECTNLHAPPPSKHCRCMHQLTFTISPQPSQVIAPIHMHHLPSTIEGACTNSHATSTQTNAGACTNSHASSPSKHHRCMHHFSSTISGACNSHMQLTHIIFPNHCRCIHWFTRTISLHPSHYLNCTISQTIAG